MTEPLLWMMLLLLAGLVIGSFLALVSVRLPAGQSVVLDRSRCPHCGHALAPFELVPVLSYLLLKRRCRSCREPISARYALIELSAGAIGLVAGAAFHGPLAVAAAVLGWSILILSILDVEHLWLPDSITLPLIVSGLGLALLVEPRDLPGHLIGAFVGYAGFELVRRAYRHLRGREGLGGGDGKLFAASGAWLGWEYLPFLLLLSTAIALLAVLVTYRTKSYGWTSALPFGPFLGFSTWCFYLAQRFLQNSHGQLFLMAFQ